MGLLELLLNTCSQTWHIFRFIGRLVTGHQESIEFLYKFIRGPSASERCQARNSSKIAKDRFRPKQIINADGTTRLAEAGERGGILYRTVKATMGRDIAEFGIGIALYFTMMFGYFALLFVQFMAVLPSAVEYYGKAYSDGQPGVKLYLKGSAVCTRFETITVHVTEDVVIKGHGQDIFYAAGSNVTEEMHMCPLTRKQASLNMISLSCFTVLMTLFWRYLFNKVEAIDEESQTAQDYSIEVLDPEADANDPDEWYEFFSHFGEVASISVGLDNGDLLRALADSRVHKIQKALRENHTFDDVTVDDLSQEDKWLHTEVTKTTKAIGKLMSVVDTDHEHEHRMNTQFIEQAVQRTYSVSKIWCIFEHESGQRNCLGQLSNGIVPAWLDIGDLPDKCRFRGTNVLSVREATEPTEVIWEKLGNRSTITALLLTIASNFVIFGVCAISVYAIGVVSRLKSGYVIYYTAATVSLLSSVVPVLICAAVDTETHSSRTDVERAILTKQFVFDVMTGAFAIWVFTDFEKTLDPLYLDQVQQVLVFDSLVGPIISWIQPWVYMKRHFFAPILSNKHAQESYFTGLKVCVGTELAHRLSTMLLGLFAVAILPLGLGITCLAFLIAYWESKHGLFRRWLRLPNYGTALLPMCCLFTYVGIVVSVVMSGQFYAGWPFDRVCFEDGDHANEPYLCNKRPNSWIMLNTHSWMTPLQRQLVHGSKALVLFFVVMIACGWLGLGAKNSFKALFIGHASFVGESQGVPYTTVDEIQAYIPFVEHAMLETPLLCCDHTLFDHEYIHFQGDAHLYDLFSDVDRVTRTDLSHVNMSALFSVCKFYPTADNPDATRKVDDGDNSFGTLWVTIQSCTGAKAHGLFGARKVGMKMQYAKGKYHTGIRHPSVEYATKLVESSTRRLGHDLPESQRPSQTKTEWTDEFAVHLVDLKLPLQFSVRDYSFAKTRKLGTASLDLQQDVLCKLPKEGGRLDCDVTMKKVRTGSFLFGVPFEDGTMSVALVWEPGESFLQVQEQEPAKRTAVAEELAVVAAEQKALSEREVAPRNVAEGGVCSVVEEAARQSPPLQPDGGAGHPSAGERPTESASDDHEAVAEEAARRSTPLQPEREDGLPSAGQGSDHKPVAEKGPGAATTAGLTEVVVSGVDTATQCPAGWEGTLVSRTPGAASTIMAPLRRTPGAASTINGALQQASFVVTSTGAARQWAPVDGLDEPGPPKALRFWC
jgi:hypothetical protein